MDKKQVVNKIMDELNKYEDIDDKLDALPELLIEYVDHPNYKEIFIEIYDLLEVDAHFNNHDIDPKLSEFINALESTNELILTEQYDKAIEILLNKKEYAEELISYNEIELDKFEIGCYFNEIEKQLFFYLESDPNKDIHLLSPYAGEYYSRLALVYHNSLQYEKAIECYKIILKYNPCSNQALLGMAYIAYHQENYLTAIEYVKEFSKYAFSSEMIFEAYQILTNIYIQYGKYDYAAICAFLGSSFALEEENMHQMLNIYEKYRQEILINFDDDSEVDNFLSKEDLIYMPNDRVMDVLYTMLEEFKDNPSKKEDFIDLAEIILSIVDDEEVEKEYNELLKEYN